MTGIKIMNWFMIIFMFWALLQVYALLNTKFEMNEQQVLEFNKQEQLQHPVRTPAQECFDNGGDQYVTDPEIPDGFEPCSKWEDNTKITWSLT